MAFLANKTVNRLYVNYGLLALAASGGGVFFAVFLIKAGVAIPVVLCAFALINAGRFVLRPLVLVAAKRVGLKPIVIAGALVLAAQYPILAQVDGLGPALAALVLTVTVGETFYWTAYHAYFGQLGDAEHRGHQTSAREAIAAIVGIAGPGGRRAGRWRTSGRRSPSGRWRLSRHWRSRRSSARPTSPCPIEAQGGFAEAKQGFLLYLADGWIGAGTTVMWQIVLSSPLSGSFTAFGGAMALAALVGAATGLLLGRHVDAGKGVRVVWLCCLILTATLVLRASAASPAMAVAANALGALITCIYYPTHMTAAYNLAKRSPCAFPFPALGRGRLGHRTGCGLPRGGGPGGDGNAAAGRDPPVAGRRRGGDDAAAALLRRPGRRSPFSPKAECRRRGGDRGERRPASPAGSGRCRSAARRAAPPAHVGEHVLGVELAAGDAGGRRPPPAPATWSPWRYRPAARRAGRRRPAAVMA